MVDDCRWQNMYNGDFSCYFPPSWLGKLALPNQQNVIPDICTALLSFLLSLQRYNSVTSFLEENEMDGKYRCRFLQPWYIKQVTIKPKHLVGLQL
jgi:hypothetical protein